MSSNMVCLEYKEILENLKSKTFSTRKRFDSKYRSNNWVLFHEIVTDERLVVSNFVFCTKCKSIIKYDTAGGTGNLNKHRKRCSSQRNTMDSYAVKNNIKFEKRDTDEILSAAKRFCYKDLRPFTAIEGDGLIDLLYTVSAITARHGLLSKDIIKNLLPHPTTVSRLI